MSLSARDRQGIWLMLGVATVVAVLFGFDYQLKNRKKPGADGCTSKDSRSTIVLLDYTDSLPKQTRDEIEARAMAWVSDSVRQGERVSVFAARAESIDSLEPSFSRCRPPEDGNALIENARRIRQGFDSAFNRPLRAVLGAPRGASNESPIAQAVIDLSLSKYMRADTLALLVFSDLLEHSPPRFSLYSCTDEKLVVAQFRASRTGMQERPAFKNLRVMLNVIPRAGMSRATIRCRDALWLWFFGDDKGPLARVEPSFLPGGSTP